MRQTTRTNVTKYTKTDVYVYMYTYNIQKYTTSIYICANYIYIYGEYIYIYIFIDTYIHTTLLIAL